jgi:hypothetical protein
VRHEFEATCSASPGGLYPAERSAATLTVLEVSAKHMRERRAPAAAARRAGLRLLRGVDGRPELFPSQRGKKRDELPPLTLIQREERGARGGRLPVVLLDGVVQ